MKAKTNTEFKPFTLVLEFEHQWEAEFLGTLCNYTPFCELDFDGHRITPLCREIHQQLMQYRHKIVEIKNMLKGLNI